MKSPASNQEHPRSITQEAEAERMRILHQDILGHKDIHLHPLAPEAVEKEISRFSQEIWRMPNMEGYFSKLSQ